jgi:hypothetical protein
MSRRVFSGRSGTAEAKTSPSAKLEITGTSVALGVGYVWGQGKLSYGNNDYDVKLTGLSAVALGAATLHAHGEVYHLIQLQDFAGTYTASSPPERSGAAVGRPIFTTSTVSSFGCTPRSRVWNSYSLCPA